MSLEYIDQLGKRVALTEHPKRIVSLVPSQTELLFDLGLDNEVAGITKFCIHPANWFKTKTRIGGTKKIDFSKIRSLNPDLIIGNKEENEQQQIEQLMKEFPVWMSDIKNLNDALRMIASVGEITGTSQKASQLTDNIQHAFEELKQHSSLSEKQTAIYLIWNDPLMAAGRNTFIHDMMTACGLQNVVTTDQRYPILDYNALRELNPQNLLLSSEPFPFKKSHADQIAKVLPNTKIMFVDGEMFSWYGSRLIKAPSYFEKLISQFTSTF